MTYRMRSWRERIATPLGYASHTPPAVRWPPHHHDLVMDVDMVLHLVQAMVGTLEDEPFDEPSQEQVDEWLLGMMDE